MGEGEALRRFWWIPLGVILVMVGATVLMSVDQTQSFGWFSYSPTTETDIAAALQDQRDAASRRDALASVALIAGLIVLAGGAAYRVGRRQTAPGIAGGASSTAVRRYWWLPLGLALGVVGVVLLASLPTAGLCSAYGVSGELVSGGTCQDEIDALGRTWFLGALLGVAGVLAISWGVGHRLGRRQTQTAEDPSLAL
jgi:hypothetical protein